jgi:hypothetical protein
MNRRTQYRIPAFRGFRSFKPLQPEPEEDIPDLAADPSLQPEEQGAIKRYLRYADTLIHGSEPPLVAESIQPISGPPERRASDNSNPDRSKKIA